MNGATPVPDKLIFCGLLLALSVIVTWPLREPAAVGVKVMLITQLPLAATEAPQVLVCAKSPLTTMLATLSATLELLESVTVLTALVLPMATLPNDRELFERLARWACAAGTPNIINRKAAANTRTRTHGKCFALIYTSRITRQRPGGSSGLEQEVRLEETARGGVNLR